MKLTCYGTYADEKEFWLPSKEINALYYMNTSDRIMKYRGLFSECLNDNAWNIRRVIKYQDELFFFSMHAYQVWKLNQTTNEIKEYIYCSHPVSQITSIEIIRDKVWVIPNSFSSPIVCFDLKEKNGHVFRWDSEAYLSHGTGSFTRAARSGDKLYFATRNRDDIHLCVLDCWQETLVLEDLSTLSLIQCIGIDDDKLWVFGEDRQKKNVLQEYDVNTLQKKKGQEVVLCEKLREGGLLYFQMLVLGKDILLLPAWAKEVILIDLETKEEKIIEYPEEFYLALKKIKGVIFNEIQRVDKKIYFMPYLIPQILMLDTETMAFGVWKVEVAEEERMKALKRYFHSIKTKQINEKSSFSVSDFCEILQEEDFYTGNNMQDNRGCAIYQHLK